LFSRRRTVPTYSAAPVGKQQFAPSVVNGKSNVGNIRSIAGAENIVFPVTVGRKALGIVMRRMTLTVKDPVVEQFCPELTFTVSVVVSRGETIGSGIAGLLIPASGVQP
jgi:hypothetical protein